MIQLNQSSNYQKSIMGEKKYKQYMYDLQLKKDQEQFNKDVQNARNNIETFSYIVKTIIVLLISYFLFN